VYDTYWVQTGSFSTQNKAEGVKEVLASKGITSIVENRDVNGTLFYRVRVGPYTSSNEADYWLSLIKTINGFEDSQVWKSQARQ
jgi:DedD protein